MEIWFLFILYIMWRVFYWGQLLQSNGEFFWHRKYVKIPKKHVPNTFIVINR